MPASASTVFLKTIIPTRYAKATFRKDRRLCIRLSSKDLEAIQKRALAEGLPYQTLIASLLHKYAAGRIAYFYLYELDRLIQPCNGTDPGWRPDLGVGTFIDCWDPECYAKAHNRALAAFNDAEADEKVKAIELKQANDLAATLQTAAETAQKNRRADILAEIAAHDCCAKCPPVKEGAGREAR